MKNSGPDLFLWWLFGGVLFMFVYSIIHPNLNKNPSQEATFVFFGGPMSWGLVAAKYEEERVSKELTQTPTPCILTATPTPVTGK